MHVPRKRFGQHFLHDKLIIDRILQAISPSVHDHMVEIGPGQGALTVHLLKYAQKLDAIELDRDLIPALALRCRDKGLLHIHQADALDFDFSSLGPNQRVVGNLPYNISTPLIFHLLKYADLIKDMHFMLQKEVVDRIAALPGSEDYGRLSVMVQYHCTATALFDVPPGAFYPPPQVQSSVVKLIPHPHAIFRARNYEHFELIVKHAFSQRRKTLRNSLKNLVTDEDWEKIAIDSQLRPEVIGVREFVSISNQVAGE